MQNAAESAETAASLKKPGEYPGGLPLSGRAELPRLQKRRQPHFGPLVPFKSTKLHAPPTKVGEVAVVIGPSL